MLNRTAEKVLKCIVKKSGGNLDETINISCDDFKNKISSSLITSICHQLCDEDYIDRYYPSYDKDGYVDLFLNHNGYSYFDNKRSENFRFWLPVILADVLSAVALIVAILAYLKQ